MNAPLSKQQCLASTLAHFNGTKYHVCDDHGKALCNGEQTKFWMREPAQSIPDRDRCNRKACRMNYPSFRAAGDKRVFK